MGEEGEGVDEAVCEEGGEVKGRCWDVRGRTENRTVTLIG